jgi:DNA-binding transcriptional ArsR family regulator
MPFDDVLTALADDTRRAILHRLSKGEARVTDVAAPFDISLNSVSKHIRILERAGLVKRRVAGRDHFLSLDPRALNDVAEWIGHHRDLWTRRLDALEAALNAEDAINKARKRSSK